MSKQEKKTNEGDGALIGIFIIAAIILIYVLTQVHN